VCFSPQADLVGGAVIGAIGIDTLRSARQRHGHLALASLPLLFGVHQLIETAVWLGLQGHLPHTAERVALWAYLLIAFVLLPVFVPLAVLLSEPSRRRRLAMVPLVVLGLAVASVLFAAMVRRPVEVKLRPHHLAYSLVLDHAGTVIVLYVVAVCLALLLSSQRRVVIFGVVNLAAVGVIAWLTVDGFASVWCGWAAVTSAVIALHLRMGRMHRASPLDIRTA
jgi:hypothetical protein